MKKLLINLVIAIAVLTASLPVHAGTITVKGSDTMVILAQKWAEVYMAKHPDVKIQVTGGILLITRGVGPPVIWGVVLASSV